jgi:hypothetical protein
MTPADCERSFQDLQDYFDCMEIFFQRRHLPLSGLQFPLHVVDIDIFNDLESHVSFHGFAYGCTELYDKFELAFKDLPNQIRDHYFDYFIVPRSGIPERSVRAICNKYNPDSLSIRSSNPEARFIFEIGGALGCFERFTIAHAALGITAPPYPRMAKQLLRAGFAPAAWMGTWPEGYFLAVRPPWNQAAVPPEWQATPEQIRRGNATPAPRTPIAIQRPDDLPVVGAEQWKELVALSPREAVLRHFSPMVASDPGRACLDLVAGSAVRLAIKGLLKPSLVITLKSTENDATCDLVCAAPYTGAIDDVPRPMARVLRRHNGMVLRPEDALVWHSWKEHKGSQRVEWDAGYAPAGETDGLFKRKPPIAFTYQGSEYWLYHPARTIGDEWEMLLWQENEFTSRKVQCPMTWFLLHLAAELKVIDPSDEALSQMGFQ